MCRHVLVAFSFLNYLTCPIPALEIVLRKKTALEIEASRIYECRKKESEVVKVPVVEMKV